MTDYHPIAAILLAIIVSFAAPATAQQDLRSVTSPHDRVWAGASPSLWESDAGATPWTVIEGGLAKAWEIRNPLSEWQLRNRFLQIGVRYPTSLRTTWNMRFQPLEIDVLRVGRPSTFHPLANWSVRASGGAFRASRVDSNWTTLHVEALDVAFLGDLLGDPRFLQRLGIGPFARHWIDRSGDLFEHRIVPAAGLAVLYTWESENGMFLVDAEGRCGWEMVLTTVDDPATGVDCRAEIRGEAVLFGIDDLSLGIPVHIFGETNHDGERRLGVTAGLRAAWSLDRAGRDGYVGAARTH